MEGYQIGRILPAASAVEDGDAAVIHAHHVLGGEEADFLDKKGYGDLDVHPPTLALTPQAPSHPCLFTLTHSPPHGKMSQPHHRHH